MFYSIKHTIQAPLPPHLHTHTHTHTRIQQLRSCLNLGINMIILLWLCNSDRGPFTALFFPWSSGSEQLRPPMRTYRHSSALGQSKQAQHTDPKAALDVKNIGYRHIERPQFQKNLSSVRFFVLVHGLCAF